MWLDDKRTRHLTDDELKLAVKLRTENNLYTKHIAKILGIGDSTFRLILDRDDIQLPDRILKKDRLKLPRSAIVWNDVLVRSAESMWNARMPVSRIPEELGVSLNTFLRARRKGMFNLCERAPCTPGRKRKEVTDENHLG